MQIENFSVPHDAQDPVGFHIRTPDGSVGILTDLGQTTRLVLERVRGANALFIEANYDLNRLQEDTRRPWAIKQRIMSRHGHLKRGCRRGNRDPGQRHAAKRRSGPLEQRLQHPGDCTEPCRRGAWPSASTTSASPSQPRANPPRQSPSSQRLAKRGSVATTAVAGVSGTTRRRRIRFATGRRKNRQLLFHSARTAVRTIRRTGFTARTHQVLTRLAAFPQVYSKRGIEGVLNFRCPAGVDHFKNVSVDVAEKESLKRRLANRVNQFCSPRSGVPLTPESHRPHTPRQSDDRTPARNRTARSPALVAGAPPAWG